MREIKEGQKWFVVNPDIVLPSIEDVNKPIIKDIIINKDGTSTICYDKQELIRYYEYITKWANKKNKEIALLSPNTTDE